MKLAIKFIFFFSLLFNGFYCGCVYAQSSTINLLSYNVYFDDRSGKIRYPAIINFIKKGQYDIILLQECTSEFIKRLSQDEMLKHYTLVKGDPAQGYSNIILTSQTFEQSGDIPIDSNMGRSAPFLVLQDDKTVVINVHLESGLTDSAGRKKQITQILKASRSLKNVIIAGDFNFGEGEQEENLFAEFNDLGKASNIVTYDIENNPIADQTKFLFEKSRRLDRIYLKCATCKDLDFKVNKLTYSDHWPISAVFSIESNPTDKETKTLNSL